MSEEDQITLIHVAHMAQYEPTDAKIEAHILWLVSQLESPHRAPLLVYRLLLHLNQLTSTHAHFLSRIVQIINYYLLHERFQIASAAQQLLSTLLVSHRDAVKLHVISANTVEFSIESLLEISGKSAGQPGEAQAINETFRAFNSIHDLYPELTLPFIDEICRNFYRIIQERPQCAHFALQALELLSRDPTTVECLNSADLCSFFGEAILQHMNQTSMAGLLFAVVRNVARSLSSETTVSIVNSLKMCHSRVFGLLSDFLSGKMPESPNNELDDTQNALLMLLDAYSVILHNAPQECVPFLGEVLLPLVREHPQEIVAHETVALAILQQLASIFRVRSFLSWTLISLNTHHILHFVAICDSSMERDEVKQVLSSILHLVLASDSGETHEPQWQRLLVKGDAIHGIKSSQWKIRGSAWQLGTEYELITVVDLLYLALLSGDFEFISAMVDSSSAYGRATVGSPWQDRLRLAMVQAFNEELVYHLSPTQLVRVATVWSYCFERKPGNSSSTNEVLITALASLKLNFSMLLPTRFYTLEGNEQLVPGPLFLWLMDHLQVSLLTAGLHLLNSLGQSRSNPLQQACLKCCLGHSNCIKLLVDSYGSNAVCSPIISPSQALSMLAQEILPSCSTNDSQHQDEVISVETTTATRLARFLIGHNFPIAIPDSWIPEMDLDSIGLHIGICTRLLLAELERHDATYTNTRNGKHQQEIFGKYWKALESFSNIIQQRVDSSMASGLGSKDVSLLFHQVDSITVQMLNIWNILVAKIQISIELASRIIKTQTAQRMWSSFRFSLHSSPRSIQQMLGLVSRANANRNLSIPGNESSMSVAPQPSANVLNAILISVYHLTQLESSLPPEECSASRTSVLLRHLKEMETGNPLAKLVYISCIGKLTLALGRYRLDCASRNQIFPEELKFAFLVSCSSLLTDVLASSRALISELSAVTLIRATSLSTDPSWLQLPQVVSLLSIALSSAEISSPLSKSISLVILAIVTTASRLSPSEMPKPLLSRLLSPRLLRSLLLSEDYTCIRISYLVIYSMLKCGMWKSAVQRDARNQNSLIEALRSILVKHSLSSRPSPRNKVNMGIVEFSGIFVCQTMVDLESDMKNAPSLPRSAKSLLAWLEYLRM